MRTSFTIHVDHITAERLKNAAHARGHHSVASFLIATLTHAVDRLERDHHRGEPFPPRPTLTQKIGGAA